MKSFVIAVTLCVALALVRAAPTPTDEEKANKAVQECNATIPVQRNPRFVLKSSIAAGNIEFTKLSKEETCFLQCYLQKVGFLDENANIKNGKQLVQFTLKNAPEIAKYSDVIIAQIFQITRSTKAIEDKCFKAFIAYHQFASNIFTLEIAEGLESSTGVKDKIVNSIQTGQPVEKEVEADVKNALGLLEILITGVAEAAATVEAPVKTA